MKCLKIHSLSKGWCDKDELLLHAAFQILVDFIEQEKPNKITDWNAQKEHRKAWKEICALYKWWKKERPNRKEPLDSKRFKHPELELEKIPGSNHLKFVEPDKKKYAAFYRAAEKQKVLEKQWESEDQKNLHRLVNIREFLWT